MDKEFLKQALKELFESGELQINLTEKAIGLTETKRVYPVVCMDDVEIYRGTEVVVSMTEYDD